MEKRSGYEVLAGTLTDIFESPREFTQGGDPANIADMFGGLVHATHRISTAISDEASPGTDETGGRVGCVVEAMMGMTAGLCRIAQAIGELAEAVREHGETIAAKGDR